tara:strand:- start:166 stop:993 length:828 start_codon:yes stop_codon:yes gene_type:complete
MLLHPDFVNVFDHISLFCESDNIIFDYIIIDSNDHMHINNSISNFPNSKVIIYTDLKDPIPIPNSYIFAPFCQNKPSPYSFNGLDYYMVDKLNKRSLSENLNLSNILVSFGSIDETNNLFFVINKIFELNLESRYNYHFLIGKDYLYKQYIDEYLSTRNDESLFFYSPSFDTIYDFFLLGDVLIGCCGLTTYEALHFGLPVVNIVQNDLQNSNAQFLKDEFGMPNLGYYPDDNSFYETMCNYLPKNFTILKNKASSIISGNGLDLVTKELLKILQ